MQSISYWKRGRKQRASRAAGAVRRFICWFPAFGMSILCVIWVLYTAHLLDALPDPLEGYFMSAAYLAGAHIQMIPVPQSNATCQALVLAPFALGLPFLFIVKAIRRDQAEKMRVRSR